jgi:membrane dipeptidase
MVAAHRAGRVGSMLGIEGGRQIGGSMAALRRFYDLGVRYMTLTHNQTTEWADAGTDEAKHDGLSPFGIEVIKEMNRLGMLSTSVTSARLPCATRSPRQRHRSSSRTAARRRDPAPAQRARRRAPLDARQWRRGHGHLGSRLHQPEGLGLVRQSLGEEARLKAIHRASQATVTAELKKWEERKPRPATGIADVADHIDHVAKVAGHDHVGIGGDLDGIPYTPTGLEGVEAYPRLFAELIRRGWSDQNLAKLAGGNVLRALRGAEATARSMKDVPPSMAALELAAAAK